MIQNYIKIAIRNLVKNKGYAFINIFGLATGIACCILIMLFVRHEWQHDSFHEKGDRIYRLVMHTKGSDGKIFQNTLFPDNTAEALVDAFPSVVNASGYIQARILIYHGTESYRTRIGEVDADFLKMFTYPLIVGDPATALNQPDNIVVSKSFADKMFGDSQEDYASIIGKVVSLRGNQTQDYIITGVMEDVPLLSSFRFEVLIPLEHYNFYGVSNNWAGAKTVYLEVEPGSDIAAIDAAMPSFVETLLGEKYRSSERLTGLGEIKDVLKVTLQPLSDIYLNNEMATHYHDTGNRFASYVLAIIAFLVLVIACINFTTLSIGKSSRRALEVGMRKALGAMRTQVMAQFWGEALLLSLISMILGLLLAKLALPMFNELAEKQLSLSLLDGGDIILLLFGMMLLTGLIAGSYPALVLSRFQPISVFKGEIGLGKPNRLTRTLVVLQYTLSIALMIVTALMSQQLTYMLGKDLGYNHEQLVLVFTPDQTHNERLKTQLLQHQQIISAGASDRSFTSGWQTRGIKNDAGEWLSIRQIRIDPDYLAALEIPLLEGRNFSYERPADITGAVIVNETFVKTLGWDKPIGRQLNDLQWGGESASPTVIGVAKDFHIDKLHKKIQPLMMHMNPDQHGLYCLFVRIKPENISGTMDFIKTTWEGIAPDLPFAGRFLDENLQGQYREEQRWRKIVGYAAIFAIMISCLGLLGLAALDVARRTKEIGIRKVLGASAGNLVQLLSKDFMILLLIANIIAWPIAYYTITFWLQEFEYRIDPGWIVFAGAGILAVLIALLTVGFHAIRAALANPIRSLRYE